MDWQNKVQMYLYNILVLISYPHLIEFAGFPRTGEAFRGGNGGGGAVALRNNWGDTLGDIIGLLPPCKNTVHF